MKTLKIGDAIPQFEAIDQNGTTWNNESLKGKRFAIYFYPKDNTPGCTAQACNLRDHMAELKAKGINVLGVSMDSVNSHNKFIDKFELPFPLIADEQKSMIEAFGVWGPKKFMGKIYDGIHRMTFITNESAEVEHIIAKPQTKAHAEEILALFEK